MESKCKKCKIGGSGRICGYKNRECSGSNYKYFEPIEEKPMEKKYRVLKELRFNNGFWQVNGIFEECDLQPFDVKSLLNQFYIEEVKEDTLESIIDNNFIGDEIKKNLKQCIIKQKIELLKEVGTGDSNKCFNRIINKISELEKEITNGEKV